MKIEQKTEDIEKKIILQLMARACGEFPVEGNNWKNLLS